MCIYCLSRVPSAYHTYRYLYIRLLENYPQIIKCFISTNTHNFFFRSSERIPFIFDDTQRQAAREEAIYKGYAWSLNI